MRYLHYEYDADARSLNVYEPDTFEEDWGMEIYSDLVETVDNVDGDDVDDMVCELEQKLDAALYETAEDALEALDEAARGAREAWDEADADEARLTGRWWFLV